MLEKMLRDDLCIGMRVTTRDGAERVVDDGLLGNLLLTEDEKAICDIGGVYTNDLYYGDGDNEHDLDIMRVMLPSGAVLWERDEVELRVFEKSLIEKSSAYMSIYRADKPSRWVTECDGKLCTFKSIGANNGFCNGYGIHRDWTRALTDEERKTWGKRK